MTDVITEETTTILEGVIEGEGEKIFEEKLIM